MHPLGTCSPCTTHFCAHHNTLNCAEQVEQAAAEVLECSEAWRKGGATAKPASSILRLLAALDELPAAAMLNAANTIEGQFGMSAV